jgi:hypothetical protein
VELRSTTKQNTTLLAVLVAGALVVLANLFVASYAPRHFMPERVLERCQSARADVVLLGTSTMVAGGNEQVLAAELRRSVCNAAVGATQPFEHELEVRKLLATHAPKVFVYGWSIGQLLPDHLEVGDLVGNRAVAFAWSRASDVSSAFDGFPRTDLQDGFSFLARRALPLLAYAPLVQTRLEILHRRIDGDHSEQNQFGAREGFEELTRRSWLGLPSQLSKANQGGRLTLSPHVLRLQQMAHAAGAHIVWVAMPLTSEARRSSDRVAGYAAYVAGAASTLGTGGDRFLDASALSDLPDARFDDGLHVAPDGARLFSLWLAKQIAASGLLEADAERAMR